MELETQVQVSTNQLRRQDEEARQLRDALDAALQRERALQARQREFQHKYTDLESKVRPGHSQVYATTRCIYETTSSDRTESIMPWNVSLMHWFLLFKWMSWFQAKYDSMQANIRNMEDAQRIAELETEVSEYKLKVSGYSHWLSQTNLRNPHSLLNRHRFAYSRESRNT